MMLFFEISVFFLFMFSVFFFILYVGYRLGVTSVYRTLDLNTEEKLNCTDREWTPSDDFRLTVTLVVLPVVIITIWWNIMDRQGFPVSNIPTGDYGYQSLFYDKKEKDIKMIIREEDDKSRFYSFKAKSFQGTPVDDFDGGTISVLEKNGEASKTDI